MPFLIPELDNESPHNPKVTDMHTKTFVVVTAALALAACGNDAESPLVSCHASNVG